MSCKGTFEEEADLAAAVDCRQDREGLRQSEKHQAFQLISHTCIQLSATLRTLEVVVDLEVAGSVAAGCKQQVSGAYRSFLQQAAVRAGESGV